MNFQNDIYRIIAEARRQKGLTQSAVAREAGCKQSAISMFESGVPGKLSQESIEKIAEIVGVNLKKIHETAASAVKVPVFERRLRGFCPSCQCFSNMPFVMDGRLFFRPDMNKASPAGGDRCAVCGEVLEKACPVCSAPLNEGACCGVCGSAYVTPALPEGLEVALWAEKRREEIKTVFGC
jgi:transcriptional regulator with XRE-family HTH domain